MNDDRMMEAAIRAQVESLNATLRLAHARHQQVTLAIGVFAASGTPDYQQVKVFFDPPRTAVIGYGERAGAKYHQERVASARHDAEDFSAALQRVIKARMPQFAKLQKMTTASRAVKSTGSRPRRW